ncbi:unnamed protein product [Ophioblennius macclurei]
MMMQMQMQDTPNQKNSLFNAMNSFIGAVNNMDQTIMVPSLLRDVPVDAHSELSSLKADADEDADMYSYYQLLKSIRRDIEWGVRARAAAAADDERRKEGMKISRTNSSASTSSSMSCMSSMSSMSSSSSSSSSEEDFDDSEDSEEEEDLEKQFQFHLVGLQGVLSKLTQQANCLTKRYKKELGIGGIGGWGQ